MPQVSWRTMMSECPAAAYVVTGLLPREDAAAGLAGARGFLLGRVARTLRLSGMYAIAEIVERDGTHVQCALASASEAAELAEAVGASDNGCYSRWASRWSFQFDDSAAEGIERALSRHAPAIFVSSPGAPPSRPLTGALGSRFGVAPHRDHLLAAGEPHTIEPTPVELIEHTEHAAAAGNLALAEAVRLEFRGRPERDRNELIHRYGAAFSKLEPPQAAAAKQAVGTIRSLTALARSASTR